MRRSQVSAIPIRRPSIPSRQSLVAPAIPTSALSGGGCTINLSPHFLDLALALMGPDVTVDQAVMSNAAWHERIEDYSCITLARGADRCVIETGYLFPAPTSTFDMHYAIRSPV